MTQCLRCVSGFASFVLLALLVLGAASDSAFAAESNTASLVTFGPKASEHEGDHDFGQLIHFSVPEGSAKGYFRVFDGDVGGAHDERYGTFDTSTEFTLYGAGSVARLYRDKTGVVREEMKGTALESVRLGVSPTADDAWLTLFAIDPARGELRNGRRHFIISVQGVAGDDGNVFGVAVAKSETTLDRPDGAELFSNLPTFQVPVGKMLSELGFVLPADARSISVENFDAAGAQLFYAGRFRSKTLTASGKNAWERDLVDIGADEAGGPGSITVANGHERPNDVTVFAGVVNDGGDPIDRPLGISVPPGAFTPNRRPELAHSETSLDCRYVRFDASASRDPEGGPLRYVWKLPPQWQLRPGLAANGLPDRSGNPIDDGARIERRFDAAGLLKGRLEGFDGSGMIASGAATEFDFLSKAAPVAVFTAPALLGEGEAFTLDGLGSTPPSDPDGTRLVSYRWDMGDGTVIEQKAGAPDFGRPTHRYTHHGLYEIRLTVSDDSGRPCNSATASKSVRVNAPPVANAGANRKAAVDEIITFDASQSTDADGQPLDYLWDFGDGVPVRGKVVQRAFSTPGQYTVRLDVDDGQGAVNSLVHDTAILIVNASPSLDGIVVPDQMVANKSAIFDAREAKDPDGIIASYAWRFSDGMTSDKPVLRRSFDSPGAYTVELVLDDGTRLSNAAKRLERRIVVTEPVNVPPVTDAGRDRDVLVNEIVKFDGSKSRDPDGSLLSYQWDFGDGETSSVMNPVHVYHLPGTYKVTLSVRDNSGMVNDQATAGFQLVATYTPNEGPHIRGGGDRASYVGEIVKFDATPTTDPDGSLISVEWDFGDGSRASGQMARHAYQAPGTYIVTMLVTDDSARPNATSSSSLKVVVTHAPNQAPVTNVPAEMRATTRDPVLFDARVASDKEGPVTSFRWDFGDGHTSDLPMVSHTYHAPDVYQATLEIKDSSGLPSGTVLQHITVRVDDPADAVPVAQAGADLTAKVGEPVRLDGGKSTDSDGSIVAYQWDLGDGRKAAGESPTVSWFQPGKYVVTLSTTDSAAGGASTGRDSLIVMIIDANNLAPVARVEADRGAAINEPVAFSGKASQDPDGSILTYAWDFGDGAKALGRDAVHAYEKPGTFSATLTITDDSGLSNGQTTAGRSIRVNDPPVAKAGEDQHVTASEVLFDASASLDRDDEILTYKWDFGDGETGEGRTTRHVYRAPGTFNVQLTVTDASATIRNQGVDGLTVIVNALPIADAGFDLQSVPGALVQFDGSRSEDPDGKIVSYKWSFGDGQTGEGAQIEHRYDQPGIYIAQLTVADDTGHPQAVDFSQIKVVVNAPPIADAGPDLDVAPGQVFQLSAAGSTDPDGTLVGYRWDIAGSDTVLEGMSANHRFDKPGFYTISLTATDDSNASNSNARDEMTVHVNHAPIAVAGSNIITGTLRTVLDARASADPDGDGLSYSWDFGDGSTGTGAVIEHTYATGGNYPVRLTVDDGRGLKNSRDTGSVTVSINRAPIAVAGPAKEGCVGDVFVFDGSASKDPDEGLLRYAWNFGDGETSSLVNPTKVFAKPGTYRVRLGVVDESGLPNASHSDEVNISVLPAPVADAGEDIRVCAGAPVRFDGTKSSDVDGVVNRFSWDFGDGSGGGDRPEHTYSKAGTYRVTLQIEGDNLGVCSPTSTDTLKVTVIDAPVAIIDAKLSAAVGEMVTFKGDRSSLDNGLIVDHQWNFDDGGKAKGMVVQHAFDKPGLYRVILRVSGSDQAAQCGGTEISHLIKVNAAPSPMISALKSVEVNQNLDLSAALSSDPDGGIATYAWEFGDDLGASGIETHHTWRKPGFYKVKLTVDDGRQLANSRSSMEQEIEVKASPQEAISADAAVCTNTQVPFALSGLKDSGVVTWDFGDGAKATAQSVTHSYNKPGLYAVTAQSPIDRVGSVTVTPFTRNIAVNSPPIAIADAPRRVCPGDVVSFRGERSFDRDGTLKAFDWDFGDGIKTNGRNVTHAYTTPGRYTAKLTVTDNAGLACSMNSHSVDVFVNAAPVAVPGRDATMFVGGAVDGVVLDATGSSDADGDTLEYLWKLSNDTEYSGQKVRADFFEPGVVDAQLTVRDPHNLACSSATGNVTLTVVDRKSPGAVGN